jgi:hypothetical protein
MTFILEALMQGEKRSVIISWLLRHYPADEIRDNVFLNAYQIRIWLQLIQVWGTGQG